MRALLLVLMCGCLDTAVDDTVGYDGIGLVPDVGFVYECDLITQIGLPVATMELHAVSRHCWQDGDAGTPAMDDFEQTWIDGVCTPTVLASHVSGGCFGTCEETHNFCWLN